MDRYSIKASENWLIRELEGEVELARRRIDQELHVDRNLAVVDSQGEIAAE